MKADSRGSRLILLRGRQVLPIARPAIADGAIAISGATIQAVGRWRTLRRAFPRASTRDLGAVVILPGLINAHCHLEYTGLANQFAPAQSFTTWLQQIVAAKATATPASLKAAWRRGADQLIRTGTTTVADILSQITLPLPPTPLRVYAFLEMTGIRSPRSPAQLVATTAKKIERLHRRRQLAGFSPHAPYSTPVELLQRTGRLARRRRWRVTTHVAESAEEFEMFTAGRGPLHDWLGKWRGNADGGGGSPVEHLNRTGLLGANLLVAHANCLTRQDLLLLRRARVSVVHCPRSHEFFQHPAFPFSRLAAAGINLCLGTDSLATIKSSGQHLPELDLLAEMRAFAEKHPRVSAATLLRWVTVNAARALGLAGQIGVLAPGAFADLIALPCPETCTDAAEVVLQHRGPVYASLIHGQWAVAPA